MADDAGDRLTIEQGQRALAEHAHDKGAEVRARYGSCIDHATLLCILEDPECVHFPVSLCFDSSKVEPGMFGSVESVSETPTDGYTIYLHEHYRERPEAFVPLTLYQLVAVSYGDFATGHDAECFGAAALGMSQDDYYDLVCRLADELDETCPSQ